MMQKNNKQNWFGITPPVSMKTPENADIEITEQLVATLREYGQYESEEEATKRFFFNL